MRTRVPRNGLRWAEAWLALGDRHEANAALDDVFEATEGGRCPHLRSLAVYLAEKV